MFFLVFLTMTQLSWGSPLTALTGAMRASSEGEILFADFKSQFTVDVRLRKNVQFWIDVYSKYDINQGIVHDAKYIDHIYEVVDIHT